MYPIFAIAGPFVLGLVLLILGVILLITLKNKIAGILVLVGGLFLFLCSGGVYLALIVTSRVQG